ncbi:hypothetical protein [Longimicrobium sp.]|uniref:DUF4097 family beta strand repeat-containing protein n=1 Tax=Longimicrobium sp. TaxID=2029185 RepID=UPI002CBE6E1E|nr:hypothetical protein [Longimicrobium sp.]HSU17614.1 hypothetical protein [Longimicrobium sp.]
MRTLRLPLATLALAALALLPRPAAAQDGDDAREWAANCERWNRDNDRATVCEQRETRIAAPRVLVVDGRENGGVSVRAWDGADVLVQQRIQAWAPSRDDARAIAGRVRVHTAGGEIYAEGPESARRTGYSVTYVVFVPRRMDLRLTANNGPLGVTGVTGRMELSVRNGPLALNDLGGNVHARATNGPLAVRLSGSRWNGEGLDAETTNGPVALTVPQGYSATLTTGTVNGPMNVDIPVTVQGRFPRQFTTQLGGGGAPVRAVTTNGPVTVRRGR